MAVTLRSCAVSGAETGQNLHAKKGQRGSGKRRGTGAQGCGSTGVCRARCLALQRQQAASETLNTQRPHSAQPLCADVGLPTAPIPDHMAGSAAPAGQHLGSTAPSIPCTNANPAEPICPLLHSEIKVIFNTMPGRAAQLICGAAATFVTRTV